MSDTSNYHLEVLCARDRESFTEQSGNRSDSSASTPEQTSAFETSGSTVVKEQAQATGVSVSTQQEEIDLLCAASASKNQDQGTMEAAANGGMDRFLQKMRSDLMYELRNIQHGEKPVTGQNHREQIQKFMEKHVVSDEAAQNRDQEDTEIQRPEAVVVEVQGIIEQRRVSSVLQSAAFRRQLENVIRGSIQSTQRQSPVPRPRRTRAVDNTASANPSPSQASVRSPPVPPPVNRQGTVPRIREDVFDGRPQLTRQESSDSVTSVDSFSSARSSAENDALLDELDEAVPSGPQGVPDLRQVSARVPRSTRNQHNLPQGAGGDNAQGTSEADTGMANLTWDDINNVHREELVEEISDLLHSQLVTSTLDGEFRATLELLVQNRVEASGTNGHQVQNTIRSLPRSGVIRNDFSHLGIPTFNNVDNQDNISVTSFSAHSVPYTQTNTHLTREVQGLKTQILEMKNMLKLTFDLQMDIQRAIRQEVAAAMQSFVAQGATAAPVHPASKPISDTHCLICLDKHADSVLYQCGHMCVCYMCGKNLMSRGLVCPVCRAPIKDIIRAYKTNVE